jgi:hypothetical protein
VPSPTDSQRPFPWWELIAALVLIGIALSLIL